jgi:sulfoxide reductase catalytic subunit YedY
MHVIHRRGWEIPERLATPEHLFFNRRALLAGAGALSLVPRAARAQRISDLPDPTKDLYPVKRNEKFTLDRPVTDEKINTNYNNFYEFGSSKSVGKAAQALKLRPWTVKIDGMVEKPQEIGIDDLVERLSFRQPPAIGCPARIGEICAHGDLPRYLGCARATPELVSLAVCRGADYRGSRQ